MLYKLQKQYRYKGYDYSQDGFYFITICCKNRKMFFGDIENEKIQLSKIGKIVKGFWLEISNHFPFVRLDEFVIMPNHIHGIIKIDNQNMGTGPVGTGQCPVPTNANTGQCPVPTNANININGGSTFGHVTPKSISTIIGSFKSITTKTINLKFYEAGFAWQPWFHDRIIRNNDELNKIRQYIMDNSLKWKLDRDNFENLYM